MFRNPHINWYNMLETKSHYPKQRLPIGRNALQSWEPDFCC